MGHSKMLRFFPFQILSLILLHQRLVFAKDLRLELLDLTIRLIDLLRVKVNGITGGSEATEVAPDHHLALLLSLVILLPSLLLGVVRREIDDLPLFMFCGVVISNRDLELLDILFPLLRQLLQLLEIACDDSRVDLIRKPFIHELLQAMGGAVVERNVLDHHRVVLLRGRSGDKGGR
jgi:hypothetical protein